MKISYFFMTLVSGLVMLFFGCDKKPDSETVDKLDTVVVTINNEKFNLEVAVSEQDRIMGLMHRKTLGRNEGMIFVFDRPQYMTFHMNNCHIDLDGIFISSTNRVINVEFMQFPRSGTSELYRSHALAQYVIELPVGTAARLGLKRGDKLDLSPVFDYISSQTNAR